MAKRIYFGYNEVGKYYYVNDRTGKPSSTNCPRFNALSDAISYLERTLGGRNIQISHPKGLEKSVLQAISNARLKIVKFTKN